MFDSDSRQKKKDSVLNYGGPCMGKMWFTTLQPTKHVLEVEVYVKGEVHSRMAIFFFTPI